MGHSQLNDFQLQLKLTVNKNHSEPCELSSETKQYSAFVNILLYNETFSGSINSSYRLILNSNAEYPYLSGVYPNF